MIDISVVNVQERRLATIDEIKELIDSGLLFINYYIDDVGKVFIDLESNTVGKFALRYAEDF